MLHQMHETLAPPLLGFAEISHFVQLGSWVTRTDIKRVGWLSVSIPNSLLNLKPTPLRNFTNMSSMINATRIPGILVLVAYVGDDINHTLTRGER